MWPEIIIFYFYFLQWQKKHINLLPQRSTGMRPSFSLDFGWTHTNANRHTNTHDSCQSFQSACFACFQFNNLRPWTLFFSLRAHHHVYCMWLLLISAYYETNCPLCRYSLNKAWQSHLKSQRLIENLLNCILVFLLLQGNKWGYFHFLLM